ncbi:MAG: ribbon-helix-helix protein, CopG family [Thermoanaerobaculia bacterium]
MKVISLHVPEKSYKEMKEIAASEGRPVAALIREAMADYVAREAKPARSLLDIAPHKGGGLKKRWTRSEIYDEMIGR